MRKRRIARRRMGSSRLLLGGCVVFGGVGRGMDGLLDDRDAEIFYGMAAICSSRTMVELLNN